MFIPQTLWNRDWPCPAQSPSTHFRIQGPVGPFLPVVGVIFFLLQVCAGECYQDLKQGFRDSQEDPPSDALLSVIKTQSRNTPEVVCCPTDLGPQNATGCGFALALFTVGQDGPVDVPGQLSAEHPRDVVKQRCLQPCSPYNRACAFREVVLRVYTCTRDLV